MFNRLSHVEWMWVYASVLYLAASHWGMHLLSAGTPTVSHSMQRVSILAMPLWVAEKIDTPIGKLLISVCAVGLFASPSPIIGILGMMVAYTVIRQATIATGSAAASEFALTDETKWKGIAKPRARPYTLEQEMVHKYAKVKFNTEYIKASFRPMMDDTHNAVYLRDLPQ